MNTTHLPLRLLMTIVYLPALAAAIGCGGGAPPGSTQIEAAIVKAQQAVATQDPSNRQDARSMLKQVIVDHGNIPAANDLMASLHIADGEAALISAEQNVRLAQLLRFEVLVFTERVGNARAHAAYWEHRSVVTGTDQLHIARDEWKGKLQAARADADQLKGEIGKLEQKRQQLEQQAASHQQNEAALKQQSASLQRNGRDQALRDAADERLAADKMTIFARQRHGLIEQLGGQLKLAELRINNAQDLIAKVNKAESGIKERADAANPRYQDKQEEIKRLTAEVQAKRGEADEKSLDALGQYRSGIESFKQADIHLGRVHSYLISRANKAAQAIEPGKSDPYLEMLTAREPVAAVVSRQGDLALRIAQAQISVMTELHLHQELLKLKAFAQFEGVSEQVATLQQQIEAAQKGAEDWLTVAITKLQDAEGKLEAEAKPAVQSQLATAFYARGQLIGSSETDFPEARRLWDDALEGDQSLKIAALARKKLLGPAEKNGIPPVPAPGIGPDQELP